MGWQLQELYLSSRVAVLLFAHSLMMMFCVMCHPRYAGVQAC